MASGLTAAWWLGLMNIEPNELEVTVPRNSHGRSQPGVRVRRRDLREDDVFEKSGLRVTGLALTVLEASARKGGGPKIMDSALQRRLGLADLQRAHLRNRGRWGAVAARRMLQAASGGARSEAERILIQLLRSGGITGWHANYRVGPYVVDVAIPQLRIAIEVDGWAFHSDREAFQNDRTRQNWLALHGWQVLRFTWLDITQYPERVLAAIQRATLAR